jgi:hypothetical protein
MKLSRSPGSKKLRTTGSFDGRSISQFNSGGAKFGVQGGLSGKALLHQVSQLWSKVGQDAWVIVSAFAFCQE